MSRIVSEREYSAIRTAERFFAYACITVCLVLLYAMSQRLDRMDKDAEREHAARQAQATEADRYAELDAKGRQMVAFEQIKK